MRPSTRPMTPRRRRGPGHVGSRLVARLLADLTPLRVSADYRRIWFALSHQQHRPADDRGRRRHPGLRDHAVVVRGRAGRPLPARAAHRLRPVRRRALRHPRPPQARARHGARPHGLLGGPRSRRRSPGSAASRCSTLVVAVQSAFFAVGNPARRRDHPAAHRHRAAARGQRARHARVERRLHHRPAARRHPHRGDRRRDAGVRRRPRGLHRRRLRHVAAAPDPARGRGATTRAGWAAVKDGTASSSRASKNLQMSFYVDIAAMVFGMPRALFPAIAVGAVPGRPADGRDGGGSARGLAGGRRGDLGDLLRAARPRAHARASPWCSRSWRGGSRSPCSASCAALLARLPHARARRRGRQRQRDLPLDDPAGRVARRVPRPAAGHLHRRRRGRPAARRRRVRHRRGAVRARPSRSSAAASRASCVTGALVAAVPGFLKYDARHPTP